MITVTIDGEIKTVKTITINDETYTLRPIEPKKYVKVAGRKWCVENETRGLVSFDGINLAIKNKRKRSPSCKDFKALCACPHVWDEEKRGTWFADNEDDLKNVDKSVFFPAAGYRDTAGTISNQGSGGYYWSSTPLSSTCGYYLDLGSMGVYPSGNANYAYGFSVRCIVDD